jgi:hypothetical protein
VERRGVEPDQPWPNHPETPARRTSLGSPAAHFEPKNRVLSDCARKGTKLNDAKITIRLQGPKKGHRVARNPT